MAWRGSWWRRLLAVTRLLAEPGLRRGARRLAEAGGCSLTVHRLLLSRLSGLCRLLSPAPLLRLLRLLRGLRVATLLGLPGRLRVPTLLGLSWSLRIAALLGLLGLLRLLRLLALRLLSPASAWRLTARWLSATRGLSAPTTARRLSESAALCHA